MFAAKMFAAKMFAAKMFAANPSRLSPGEDPRVGWYCYRATQSRPSHLTYTHRKSSYRPKELSFGKKHDALKCLGSKIWTNYFLLRAKLYLRCICAYLFFGSKGSDIRLKIYSLTTIWPCSLVIHAQKIGSS